MCRVFTNGPGDLGSLPGRVIQKTQKWYLMPPCLTLSFIRYEWRVKRINPGKGVTLLPTPRCSSYWKGRLRVTLSNFTFFTYSARKQILQTYHSVSNWTANCFNQICRHDVPFLLIYGYIWSSFNEQLWNTISRLNRRSSTTFKYTFLSRIYFA